MTNKITIAVQIGGKYMNNFTVNISVNDCCSAKCCNTNREITRIEIPFNSSNVTKEDAFLSIRKAL